MSEKIKGDREIKYLNLRDIIHAPLLDHLQAEILHQKHFMPDRYGLLLKA
ncbi:hypothetical protein AVDCRST_MAG94-1258, partial [uncultured Leptolyngbya sp.]